MKQAKVERLREINRTATLPLLEEAKAALEKIDKVMEGYMIWAEKKCRKIYFNHYKFSPTVKLWLDRCHSYRALIRLTNKLKELSTTNLKQVKDANPANIYRAAERCGINDPKEIQQTIFEVQALQGTNQTTHGTIPVDEEKVYNSGTSRNDHLC